MDTEHTVRFTLNGESMERRFPSNLSLLNALRYELGATEVKNGCEKGDCGACVVLVDGRAENTCCMLAVQADGKELLTVKGMGTVDALHPLQQAFIELGAIQCGFCTPGMLCSAKALLDEHPEATRQEIKVGISGNLCRCTGYVKIVDAVEAVVQGKY
jgi:carbon-monoxide dehydrogenase small subunit